VSAHVWRWKIESIVCDIQAQPNDIFTSQATNLLFNNLFRECPKDRMVDQRLHKLLLKLLATLCPEQAHTPSGNMNAGIAAGAIRRVMDSLLRLRDAEAQLKESNVGEVDPSLQSLLTGEQASSLVAETLKSIFRAKDTADRTSGGGGVAVAAAARDVPTDLPSRVGVMEAKILGGFHHGFTPQLNRNGPLSPGDVSRLFQLRDSAEQIVGTCIAGKQVS
jgi:hypothetical protein